jgi:hypothetical protein
MELALLFPNGKTQHHPADGGPISIEDVRVAQSRHKDLVELVAEFRSLKSAPKPPVAVAAADPAKASPASSPQQAQRPTLQLAAAARLAERPSAPTQTRPSDTDRRKLTELAALATASPPSLPQLLLAPTPAVRRPAGPQLASLTTAGPTATTTALSTERAQPQPRVAAVDPRLGAGADRRVSDAATTFVQAPAFDEEHPEELSYRPFPVAPLLTATASVDDPALVRLQHPDIARTLDLIDQAGGMPPMRMRPTLRVAEAMWTRQFKGEAINLNALYGTDEQSAPSSMVSRKVSTTAK